MGLMHHHGLLQKLVQSLSFITELGMGESLNATLNYLNGTPVWDLGDNTVIESSVVTHTYSTAGDKNVSVKISLDAEISSLALVSNKIKGILDLSKLNRLGGTVFLNGNPKLTEIKMPTSNRLISAIRGSDCNLTGTLDLSGLTNLSGELTVVRNPNLTSIILPLSGNQIIIFQADRCNLTGTLDLSGCTNLGSSFRVYGNPNLLHLVLPISNQLFSGFQVSDCNLTGTLDLSGLSNLKGIFEAHRNPNLTNISLPVSNQIFTLFRAFDCNLTGTLDLSGLTNLGGTFEVVRNPNLTNLVLPNSGQVFTAFRAFGCNITSYPFGTKLIARDIFIENNLMTSSEVDVALNNLYINRLAFDNTVPKTLNIAGTNGAPSGILQAPSGYVQASETTTGNDGSPSTAKEEIFVLTNQNNDNSLTKKYKWTITHN